MAIGSVFCRSVALELFMRNEGQTSGRLRSIVSQSLIIVGKGQFTCSNDELFSHRISKTAKGLLENLDAAKCRQP